MGKSRPLQQHTGFWWSAQPVSQVFFPIFLCPLLQPLRITCRTLKAPSFGFATCCSLFLRFLFLPCYGLNACVPPNSYAETLILKVMVFGDGSFGRWLGFMSLHDDQGLCKKYRSSSWPCLSLSPSPLYPSTWRFSEKVALCEPKGGLLAEPDHAGGLLQLLAFRTVRNRRLLLPPGLWCIC